MQEKTLDFLPVSSELKTLPKPSRKSNFKALLNVLTLALIAGVIGTAAFRGGLWFGRKDLSSVETFHGACEQEDVLLPQKHNQLWTNLTATFGSRDYRSKAITWLSEAVQVP
jgi:Gly-Xaa carboxypeptidase